MPRHPWSKLKSRIEALLAPGLPLAIHCNVFVLRPALRLRRAAPAAHPALPVIHARFPGANASAPDAPTRHSLPAPVKGVP